MCAKAIEIYQPCLIVVIHCILKQITRTLLIIAELVIMYAQLQRRRMQ
jgi:hypothetical protein